MTDLKTRPTMSEHRPPVTLDNVYANNVGMLRKLADHVGFMHDDAFYNELFEQPASKNASTTLAQLAYYGEAPVGGTKLKLHPKKKSGVVLKGLEIQLLVVLPHYEKGHGIPEQLLEFAEDQCRQFHQHTIYILLTERINVEWFKEHAFEAEDIGDEKVLRKTIP